MNSASEQSDAPYPEPTFKVYSASGRLVGYGSKHGNDLCEVYLPGGDEEGFMGLVSGVDVEFSSGVLAGRIEGATILYDDGTKAGEIRGDEFVDEQDQLIATTVGECSDEARAGAVLLLVHCRWFRADGSPNPDVR